MPIPARVARWNKAALNPVTRPIAAWVPGFGVVVHHGRVSGRAYHTPVNVFPARGGYVFALTYGPGTDWVRNVLAAGGCTLLTRGRRESLTAPRVFHDASRRHIRPLERAVLARLHVSDFLAAERAARPGGDGQRG